MSVVLITGSGGLVGSQAARHFSALGLHVVGVDNDMRRFLFGMDGSIQPNLDQLGADLGGDYSHVPLDIRNRDSVDGLLKRYGTDVSLVVHAAAQPAHDYADEHPLTDWDINAGGTLNMLEATRQHAPDAVFVYLSTIKVYGPHPNDVPLVEKDTRHEPDGRRYRRGFDETMSIDGGPHSLFGASKTAADVMVQEYGHAYGLRTVILRPGCLTGPAHAGTEAHGFLAYLMRCVATGRPYRVIGYGGKQVRDQLHAVDVVSAIDAIWRDPPEPGEVYNLGGGRGTDVSVLEAVALAEEIAGLTAKVEHAPARRGDHRWWVTDTAKLRARYPAWKPTYDAKAILKEIYAENAQRWQTSSTWTILIATIGQRGEGLRRLLEGLLPQVDAAGGQVKILAFWDNGEIDIGSKRQALLEAADTDYLSFVDDDDTVSDNYVPVILKAMESRPDYVGFKMQVYQDGRPWWLSHHSLKHGGWLNEGAKYLRRDITTSNPMRTDIAQTAKFAGVAKGEAEDRHWVGQLRDGGLLRSEVFIDEVLYHYWWSYSQSVWMQPDKMIRRRDADGQWWRPVQVDSPNFAWHPLSRSHRG